VEAGRDHLDGDVAPEVSENRADRLTRVEAAPVQRDRIRSTLGSVGGGLELERRTRIALPSSPQVMQCSSGLH
jgi:hypothetical protein